MDAYIPTYVHIMTYNIKMFSSIHGIDAYSYTFIQVDRYTGYPVAATFTSASAAGLPDHSGLWGFARAVRMEYPGGQGRRHGARP